MAISARNAVAVAKVASGSSAMVVTAAETWVTKNLLAKTTRNTEMLDRKNSTVDEGRGFLVESGQAAGPAIVAIHDRTPLAAARNKSWWVMHPGWEGLRDGMASASSCVALSRMCGRLV